VIGGHGEDYAGFQGRAMNEREDGVMNSDKRIILSPDVEKLKKECSLLREELAGLLSEQDHLLKTVASNILARYATTIGVKEYEAMLLDVEVRKLKRAIQMIQTVENQGKKVNLEQIEAAVEDELREWHEKVERMLDQIKAGQDRLKNLMSAEDSRELQQLYRALAKKLHPDVNPDLKDECKTLWSRVQQAYAAGDLQELRALRLIVDDIPADIGESNRLEELQKCLDKLKVQVSELLKKLENIKAQPPFTLEKKLSDKEWVQGQISECEKRIAAFSDEKVRLENWLSFWKAGA
jgi:hypothetical protein